MYIRKENIRFVIGLIIVVGIFFAIGISSCVEKSNQLDELINFDSKFSSNLPESFSSEVLEISSVGGYDIRVAKNEKIIGFSMPFSAEKSFELIKNKLCNLGWIYISSANKTNASFTKENGEYKWIFVNCIEMEGTTSVVITTE